MVATKLKIGLSVLAIAGAAVTLVLEHQARLTARDENDSLRRQIAQLKEDNETLSTRLAWAYRGSSSPVAFGSAASGAALVCSDFPPEAFEARYGSRNGEWL
jgi:hypothetical protein